MTVGADPVAPPLRLTTPRLVLRAWEPADAPALKAAIDRNLDRLRPWVPWAVHEPSPLEAIAQRLAGFRADFDAGRDWVYGIFAPDGRTVLGGTGLHPRIGPGGLEIGYWLDAAATGHGLATEAAAALTDLALALPGITRVEIRCDPANAASAAVPRRLGYAHVETLAAATTGPDGAPRDLMVWRRVRVAGAAG